MNDQRISLADRLQRQWFIQSMVILEANKRNLSPYDRELWQKLSDGYNLVGPSMTVTRKQMNHIKQVAMELEQGAYND